MKTLGLDKATPKSLVGSVRWLATEEVNQQGPGTDTYQLGSTLMSSQY